MARRLLKGGTPVWERNMNAEQLEVIRHETGPLCVLAQAGSGKTRALVHRIARLIDHCQVPAAQICAVTFSQKAAGEMNERLSQLGVEDARVGTWHSLCLQILKEDKTVWSRWQVDEKNAAKVILKEALGWKHLDWKTADLGKVTSYIGICKANLFAPDSEGAAALARAEFSYDAGRAVQAHQISQTLIEERGLLTFDDMLLFAHRHLSSSEEVRQRWAAKWAHFTQDEAQDANRAQCAIAELLCRDHRNYMVVGDVAQSIYKFRGSDPLLLATFAEQWGAKTVLMRSNYRSGRRIVTVANNVIRPAKVRAPEDMIAMRDVEGSVRVDAAPDLDGEARNFAGWVEGHVRDGASYTDLTCLFRTNAQSRALEEALLGKKIPYVIVGGTSFYERKEVKDLLAYLRVAAGRDDDGDAVRRCINAPFRYLGKAFVERVMGDSLDVRRAPVDWQALVGRAASGTGVQKRQTASAYEWSRLIEEISAAIARGARDGANEDDKRIASPGSILLTLVNRTQYIEWISRDEGEESIQSSHAANVRELIRVSERFATVGALLDYIEQNLAAAKKQRSDKQAGGERVLLMSIHRSKGLEWPHLYVVGCNEKVLPHIRGDIEEERRLAYVAATRARDTLVLSYVHSFATKEGVSRAEPSRFLRDAGLLSDHPREEPAPPEPFVSIHDPQIDLDRDGEWLAIDPALSSTPLPPTEPAPDRPDPPDTLCGDQHEYDDVGTCVRCGDEHPFSGFVEARAKRKSELASTAGKE